MFLVASHHNAVAVAELLFGLNKVSVLVLLACIFSMNLLCCVRCNGNERLGSLSALFIHCLIKLLTSCLLKFFSFK